ncbi:hypothetical protein F889_00528 [Acinetobacter colistiniresistens]|uniref:Long-chain-acyl-CoA synthetase n=1 Tax=Acinetobacter colistiniresistens TaxID=280145 RepID=N9R1Z3_9GAMM|nr:long-chain-acyl-CoA synthetase [Acinetobacter colistiniresistens]ENX36366.1 hypothetical protein F889_00528 [Acinetobacter colistiniresistens]
MSKTNYISLNRFAYQLPFIAMKLPKMLQGLLITQNSNAKSKTGLGWAVEKAAKKNPQGMAVLYQDVKLSYQEFNAWANQIANYFKAQGFRKGDVVAVLMENRPELLVLVAGLAKIGGVVALINTSQSGRVLEHSINLVKPRAAIVGQEMYDVLAQSQHNIELAQDAVYWVADADTRVDMGCEPENTQNLMSLIGNSATNNPATTNSICGSDGLFLIYTSGTTGLPKAAIFNHARFMKAYGGFGYTLQLDKNDIIYVTLPLYHATGMVVCWGAALAGYSGIALRRKFSASAFWKDVSEFQATAFGYVGELCRYLLETPPSAYDSNHQLTKMIGNGLRPNIWMEFKQRFGVQQVMEFYASSEGNIGFSNVFNFDNTMGFSPMPYAVVKYDEVAGEPLRNQKGHLIRVKHNETGLLIGKITKRTPFDGYTDTSKSQSSILTDVFKQGDCYFNTGDLVKNIGFRHTQFVDRTGDTFRWKGENVSTTEVENIISSLPFVQDAVVYGVEITGTNGRAGMAAITLTGGSVIDKIKLSVLLNHLKDNLPNYAVPLFVRIRQNVETTATFKYQKHSLKQEAFHPERVGNDTLFVLLPRALQFCPIDDVIYAAIQQGEYRF